MSDVRDEYVKFFFASRMSVKEFETLVISHPSFSRSYAILRDGPEEGLDAKIENGTTVHFEYYPLRIRQLAERGDLDYGLGIDLGDLGELIPAEIDRVVAAGTLDIKPSVVYRTYRSDNLNAPMFGPVELECASIARNGDGASIEAMAPSLNLNKTGEIYSLDRFPMLRGFL